MSALSWNRQVVLLLAGQRVLDQKKADIDTVIRLIKSFVTEGMLEHYGKLQQVFSQDDVVWRLSVSEVPARVLLGGTHKPALKFSIEYSVYGSEFSSSTPPANYVEKIYDALGTLLGAANGLFNLQGHILPYTSAGIDELNKK